MSSSKFFLNLFKVLSILFLIFLFSSYVFSVFLENELRDITQKKVEEFNKTSSYKIKIDKINFSLLRQTIVLKKIEISPDEKYLSLMENGKLNKSVAYKVFLPKVEIEGFGVISYMKDKIIHSNQLKLIESKVRIIHYDDVKRFAHKEHIQNLMFEIKGVNGLILDKIQLYKPQITFENINNKQKSEMELEMYDTSVNSIVFKKNAKGKLEFQTENSTFTLKDFCLITFDKRYKFFIKDLHYDLHEKALHLKELNFAPDKKTLLKLTETYKYTEDVFSVDIKKMASTNFDLFTFFKDDEVLLESISISDLDAKILKNKTKPWNYDKRPIFPNQFLNTVNTPIMIDKIHIENVSLDYEEKLKHSDENLKVTFKEGNIELKNIATSFFRKKAPLELSFKGKFMGSSNLDLELKMPYFNPNFEITASMSKAPLTDFNKALHPATNYSFLKGELLKVNMKATANTTESSGEMILLYHDADFIFQKHKNGKENKFKSFFGNILVKKSNPNKKGHTKVVPVSFERVPYKGLGNFLWKTSESGIRHTFFVLGKKEK
ncbi:DUF748 domain-containing protein [Aureivirga sp. CE67]|uniref:DUF748 domain-containing protein n=1 Tax=Aureivirga sp. CE67 TaxID=1788983 RepID=UPI0018CA1A1B|nr:DUF748 domain-containing protein [Aureivirga sp. CE67]